MITSANNVMALWIELWIAFENAYQSQPPDESLIERVYSFADWCTHAPPGADAAHDPLTAVTVAFHEHIPAFDPARDDMPRWFTYSEVAKNREVFSHLIGDERYDELVEYMAKNQHRYFPRRGERKGPDP